MEFRAISFIVLINDSIDTGLMKWTENKHFRFAVTHKYADKPTQTEMRANTIDKKMVWPKLTTTTQTQPTSAVESAQTNRLYFHFTQLLICLRLIHVRLLSSWCKVCWLWINIRMSNCEVAICVYVFCYLLFKWKSVSVWPHFFMHTSMYIYTSWFFMHVPVELIRRMIDL